MPSRSSIGWQTPTEEVQNEFNVGLLCPVPPKLKICRSRKQKPWDQTNDTEMKIFVGINLNRSGTGQKEKIYISVNNKF